MASIFNSRSSYNSTSMASKQTTYKQKQVSERNAVPKPTLLLAFFILLSLHSCSLVLGEEGLMQPFLVSDYFEPYENRLFSVTTTSPTFNALKNNQTAIEAIGKALDLIQSLEKLVQDRRKSNHTEACNMIYTSKWANNFRAQTPILQIGSVEETCNTRLDTAVAVQSGSISESLISNARNIIIDARKKLFEATHRGMIEENELLPKDGNWSNGMYELIPSERTNDGQKCILDSIAAYYTNRQWYLRSAVTNHPLQSDMQDYQRQTIMEFVPNPLLNSTDNPNIPNNQSLRLIHVRPSDGRLERSSTIVLLWRGKAFTGTTQDDDDFADPVTAVSQAFRENLENIDKASDSVTPSNIAILALPMAMNFIPVAFIADITALGTLLYIILTDVLSTIPFLVKGVELILWSRPRKENVISFHAGDDTLRLVEVMAVRCRGEDLFRNTGVVFIVVSCVVLVVGISLEIWAKRYMTRTKKRKEAERRNRGAVPRQNADNDSYGDQYSEFEGPFGRVVSDYTATGLLGTRRKAMRRSNNSQLSQSQVPNSDDAI